MILYARMDSVGYCSRGAKYLLACSYERPYAFFGFGRSSSPIVLYKCAVRSKYMFLLFAALNIIIHQALVSPNLIRIMVYEPDPCHL